MTEVLALQAISKRYGRVRALDSVTLTITAGDVFGVLGPNGSGKTTLLAIALGAVRADAGALRWFAHAVPVNGATRRAFAQAARRRVGALLEQPAFYPWLTGAANLRVIAAIKRLAPATIADALRATGLWEARNETFQAYSLGMKQRLGIAAALLGKPDVLVLDEPTNGVDAQGIADIRGIIARFAAEGGTVVLASHILDEVEKVCSQVAILKEGSVLKIGPVRDAVAADSWIELGGVELAALEEQLRLIAPLARLERRGELLEVRDAALSPTELNHRLLERGVVVGHLVRRFPSLESRYLETVKS